MYDVYVEHSYHIQKENVPKFMFHFLSYNATAHLCTRRRKCPGLSKAKLRDICTNWTCEEGRVKSKSGCCIRPEQYCDGNY